MTTLTSRIASTTLSRPNAAFVPAVRIAPRAERRVRDFGVGYGNSSGYASGKRYVANWGNPRFICG